MSKITNISQKTSSQIESYSQNFQIQGNKGKYQEELQQVETQNKSSGGNTWTKNHTSIGGEFEKKYQDERNREQENNKFDSFQMQESQSKKQNEQIASMRYNEKMEDNRNLEQEIQNQSQSQKNFQTSSSSHQTNYQTQTIVTKTVTTTHRVSQSQDQGKAGTGEYELMNAQSNIEGDTYGNTSALYKYGGYNLQADHAKLEGGLMFNKYHFSNASLKEKQFKSSAGQVQIACEAAMAAALKKQEEAEATGGAMADWELQLKSMAELKTQYQLSGKVTVKQRSYQMYGYGFRGKDGQLQKQDELEQEKQKEGQKLVVCDAECIEKSKNQKKEDLFNIPQDAEEFIRNKLSVRSQELYCGPEDLSKGKNIPIMQSPDIYFKPRSEDYIRLIPRSTSQRVYPVNSVRSIIMPTVVNCETVQVAKQSRATKCMSVRQPVIIQEEVTPTILQGIQYITPKLLRQQEPIITVQSTQQQLVTVQPQVIQQQAVMQIQPVVQQQQIVQVQETQQLQQVVMVQPIHKVESYSHQHISIQQPHLAQLNNTQTVQLMSQQSQPVNTVAQQLVIVQGKQQEIIPQIGVQQQTVIQQIPVQQQQIIMRTPLLQQDAVSPIRQNQIITQPQILLQPSQQHQTTVVQTQPLLQQQTIQIQQHVLQVQPQNTIHQIQQIPQVASSLRQQPLVLQSQIPLNYSTQPIEYLQPANSPPSITVNHHQFKFQNVLHKV